MTKQFNIKYTLKYALVQALYWLSVCSTNGFASVFILDRGYSNSTIGIMLAVSNIGAVVFQPIVASFADKTKKLTLVEITAILSIICAAFSATLIFLLSGSLLLTVIAVLLSLLICSIQPLINSLFLQLEDKKIYIYYGAARASGSLAYAVFSLILGYLLERYPTYILPISALCCCVGFTLAVILFWEKGAKKNNHQGSLSPSIAVTEQSEAPSSLKDFVLNNKRFMVFLLGVVLIFFSHGDINNYIYQIVISVNGTEKDMGLAVSIAAAVEIPAMVMITTLLKRFSCRTLIRISAVFFALKNILLVVMNSVAGVYLSQALQMVSYALFAPVSVYYVSALLNKKDSVKGQAFITTAINAGYGVASLAGGRLLDIYDASTMLTMSMVVALAGAVVLFLSAEKVEIDITQATKKASS